MKRKVGAGIASLMLGATVVGLGPRGVGTTAAAQASQTPARELPTFQVDPSWPKKLPNNWVMGPVSGVNVDAQDHVWVITRPREVKSEWVVGPGTANGSDLQVNPSWKAPSVIEFDGEGNYIRGWGGPARNKRVQVFTLDGKYVSQVFVSRGKMAPSTATGTLFGYPRKEVEDKVLKSPEAASRTTFSPDPQQRFLYVLDRRHQRILILDRKTLEILGSFGGGVGDQPGQFYILHDMATDSHGNFYTTEINQNSRAQKFVFKGMVSVPAK